MDQQRWDVIAISAMDSVQKSAFEKQVQQLQKSSSVSRMAVHFRVYFDDPPGVKIGGGGATLSIVNRLHAEFGSSLFEFRILLIHAGGYSQRQPNASLLGKLFIPTPVKNEGDDRPYSLFELKLRSYEILLRRMKSGLFLASSDTLEYFGDIDRLNENIDWSLDGDGFVALAHPSALDVARQHGVYVLDQEIDSSIDNPEIDKSIDGRNIDVFEAACRRVLQKPTIDTMRRETAINRTKDGSEFAYTDSCYFMSSNVVRKLLDVYEKLSPLNCELDAYGDFLQPLGVGATDDYLSKPAVNALIQNEDLLRARRYLFREFESIPLKLLIFGRSRFYHLGTFDELFRYFCDRGDFRVDFDAENILFSSISPRLNQNRLANVCVLYSDIGGDRLVVDESSKSIIEYCQFPSGFEFGIQGGRCILSNCSSGRRSTVSIPASVFMMTAPVGGESISYVTVFFGIEDDLKRCIDPTEIDIDSEKVNNAGKSIDQREIDKSIKAIDGRFSARRLIDNSFNKEIFDDRSPRSLWNARLFPGFDDMETSFDFSLKYLNDVIDGKKSIIDEEKLGDRFYSMSDLVKEKNVDALLSYRFALCDKIRANLITSGKQ